MKTEQMTKRIRMTITICGRVRGPSSSTDPWDGHGDLVLMKEKEVPVTSSGTDRFQVWAPGDPVTVARWLRQVGYIAQDRPAAADSPALRSGLAYSQRREAHRL